MFFPFQDQDRFRNQLNGFFGEDFFKKFEPYFQQANTNVDVYENEKEICVLFAMPGVAGIEALTVDIQENHMDISGHVEIPMEGYTCHEEGIFQGAFSRIIAFPTLVIENDYKSFYRNGIFVFMFKKQAEEIWVQEEK